MNISQSENSSNNDKNINTNEDNLLRPYTLSELSLYFLRLGATGFGGPIALTGYMLKDLVETNKWFSKQEYLDGLSLSQIMPGPMAAKLAMYLGWVRHGVLGVTLVALSFILPSFFMVIAISVIYTNYGDLPWMQGAFYGIGAGVIGIIAQSAYKLLKMTSEKDKKLWVVLLISIFATAYTEKEDVLLFIFCGFLYLAIKNFKSILNPSSLKSFIVLPVKLSAFSIPFVSDNILLKISIFFLTSGATIFGSGLAIIPFLHGGVVSDFHWLSEKQFLDAVAIAMITPGPVIITVAFIGYIVAGLSGAVLASFFVFFPCYLFVLIFAPWLKKITSYKNIRAFVDGLTAAANGAIAGSVYVIGKKSIIDIPTVIIAIVSIIAFVKIKKLSEPHIIVCCGIIGVILSYLRL